MNPVEVIRLLARWSKVKSDLAKEKQMAEANAPGTHYDPVVSTAKGARALAWGFWAVVGPQVLQFLTQLLSWAIDYVSNPQVTGPILEHSGISHGLATSEALLLAAIAGFWMNWRKNVGNGPTKPFAGKAVVSVLIFMLVFSSSVGAATLEVDGGNARDSIQDTANTGGWSFPVPTDTGTVCVQPSPAGLEVHACSGDKPRLCWDDARRTFVECTASKSDPAKANRFAWYAIRAAFGKGADNVTTALVINAGGSEKNPLVPTPELRLATSLIAIPSMFGVSLAAEKFFGPKVGVWVSRGLMVLHFGIAAWNLKQYKDTLNILNRSH